MSKPILKTAAMSKKPRRTVAFNPVLQGTPVRLHQPGFRPSPVKPNPMKTSAVQNLWRRMKWMNLLKTTNPFRRKKPPPEPEDEPYRPYSPPKSQPIPIPNAREVEMRERFRLIVKRGNVYRRQLWEAGIESLSVGGAPRK